MRGKVRIKDIAEKAGVSEGTVDRVIHGRGNVSQEKQEAITKALSEMNYSPNVFLSSISIKRTFKIVVTTPQSLPGDFWWQVHNGIKKAVAEYESLKLNIVPLLYDQFDIISSRATFEEVLAEEKDAVLIAPTFKEETLNLCSKLDKQGIPYVMVDSMVEGTHPVAFFSANQISCGRLIAKLLRQITPPDAEYVICQALRVGDESANNTILRKIGFMDYFKELGEEDRVRKLSFSAVNPENNTHVICDFFQKNPGVKGATVLSSRGHVISDYLKSNGIHHVKLIGMDMTDANIQSVKEGMIDYLICQRPEEQGFMAVRSLIMRLIYSTTFVDYLYMPLDIITLENINFYKRIL